MLLGHSAGARASAKAHSFAPQRARGAWLRFACDLRFHQQWGTFLGRMNIPAYLRTVRKSDLIREVFVCCHVNPHQPSGYLTQPTNALQCKWVLHACGWNSENRLQGVLLKLFLHAFPCHLYCRQAQQVSAFDWLLFSNKPRYQGTLTGLYVPKRLRIWVPCHLSRMLFRLQQLGSFYLPT